MHENSTLPSIGKFKFCDCANPESGFMENRLKYSITPHTANDWKFYLCAFDRYLFVLGRCACFDMSPACLHANQNKTFNNSILQLPEGLSTIILCAIYILLGVHLYNVDVMEQHAMGCVSDIKTPGLARNHQTFINFFFSFSLLPCAVAVCAWDKSSAVCDGSHDDVCVPHLHVPHRHTSTNTNNQTICIPAY